MVVCERCVITVSVVVRWREKSSHFFVLLACLSYLWFLCRRSESGMDVREATGSNAQQAMGFQLWCPHSAGTAASGGGGDSATASAAASPPAVVSVLVSKNAGRYRLQSDSYPALFLLCKELEQRLNKRLLGEAYVSFLASSGAGGDAGAQQQQQQGQKQGQSPAPAPVVRCADALPMEAFFAAIQTHFLTRLQIATIEAQLNDKAHQYRLVQKR